MHWFSLVINRLRDDTIIFFAMYFDILFFAGLYCTVKMSSSRLEFVLIINKFTTLTM